MQGKKHRPEQIIKKLREADMLARTCSPQGLGATACSRKREHSTHHSRPGEARGLRPEATNTGG